MNNPWTPEEIKQFERVFNVKCTLRPDGLYDVIGDIGISARGLKNFQSIPPIHTISGYFICSDNYLATLEGAPIVVGTSFRCDNNSLVTLKGAPTYVGGNFECTNNFLDTLDGIPEFIGEFFDCRNNPNLQFMQSQLNAVTIEGKIYMDPWQLIPEDPSVFIEKGILPI